ncbi:hypothetical protein CATRI_00135 [Corynebacterium atrinae]|uniref:hypothetical protein n=1 Tax=Corynebacterium atrinae TaxID=1336740 RepID=UPI0025B60B3E|nr:hypothetical protein [Corynebacterium atrinae]WJY62150.1 hypothetical protein CATRI_00135 [Corynebacterium atrinae]
MLPGVCRPDDLPRLRVYARIFGADTVAKRRGYYVDARPHAHAENQACTAQQARAEIEALRALTPAVAVERIDQTRAAEQAQRHAAERTLNERQRQLGSAPYSRDHGDRYSGPSLSR